MTKMADKNIIRKKICMLGSLAVGKTSLARRFVYNKFDEKYLSTIGVQISEKTLSHIENSAAKRADQLRFIIWDLAFVAKFDDVIRNYFRGAHGAIVVSDVTRPQTLDEIDNYLKSFLTMNPKSKIILVGNKIDLTNKNDIYSENLAQIAHKYSAPSILTSAKSNENVEKLFETLANLILDAD